MANTNSATSYYIRVRGRVLGPYDLAQLKTLRGRGQFGRANEVSTDRQTWQSAASLEHLWSGSSAGNKPAASTQLATPPEAAGPPQRAMTPVWHYAVGGEQFGPVTLLELRGMIAGGQLTAADVVWKDGLPEWLPISEVSELRAVARPQAQAAAPQQVGLAGPQNFCFACGAPADVRAEICPRCGVRQPQATATTEKSRTTAALLALFLGWLGIHRFYLGNIGLGIVYLLFSWTLVPWLVSLVEFLVFLCMSDATFAAKYGRKRSVA